MAFAAAFATTTDAAALDYTVTEKSLLKASIRIRKFMRAAGYAADPNPVPDALIDLTCAVAQRLASIPTALANGQQQQSESAPGGFSQSVGFGWDAWKAKSGLDTGELNALKQMFPRLPKTIAMGSPVDLHLDDA